MVTYDFDLFASRTNLIDAGTEPLLAEGLLHVQAKRGGRGTPRFDEDAQRRSAT